MKSCNPEEGIYEKAHKDNPGHKGEILNKQ